MAKRNSKTTEVRYILDRSRSMRDSDVLFQIMPKNKYRAIMYLRKPKWVTKDQYEAALKELLLGPDVNFDD